MNLQTLSLSPALILLLSPANANAHSFGVVYTLPVPFWLYAWGATAALLASFLISAYFLSASTTVSRSRSVEVSSATPIRLARSLRLRPLFQTISIAALVLCIASGWFGTQRPYQNFNMTYFWIILVLGFSYSAALFGNIAATLNPWRVMGEALSSLSTRIDQGLLRYPQQLAYAPAIALYGTFIWLELLGQVTPKSLAVALTGYSLTNILGVIVIGRRDWFRYGELFSVFFRLLALMAPVDYRPSTRQRKGYLKLRPPFSGILSARTGQLSLLFFILFMLSSTAFDGLHEATIWRKLFWLDLYHAALRDFTSTNPLAAFPAMTKLFLYWQSAWLLAAPFIYLGIYWLFILVTKRVARSSLSIKQLALEFALPLLPIVLVYHVAHYYTLLQTQGIKIISLISDPFGRGDNWFGTAQWLQRTFIPDVEFVWHAQVGLIVLGHIVGVYLSHCVALRLFATRAQATLSQIPLLFLMMIFTASGLWILSQPLSG